MGKPTRLSRILGLIVAAAASLIAHANATAEVLDTIYLKSGSVLKGKIVSQSDKSDSGRAWIVIKTTSGAKYKLDYTRSVESVLRASDEDIEYRKKARTIEDKAAAHLELASWCEDQKRGRTRFAEQIRWHYEQAVRLLSLIHI